MTNTITALRPIIQTWSANAAGGALYQFGALAQLIKIILLLKPLTAIPCQIALAILSHKNPNPDELQKKYPNIVWLYSFSFNGLCKDIATLILFLKRGQHLTFTTLFGGCHQKECAFTINDVVINFWRLTFRGCYHGNDSIHAFFSGALVSPGARHGAQIVSWLTIIREILFTATYHFSVDETE